MATYIVKKDIKITRQAGDDCDVIFQIPDTIQLIASNFKFAVFRVGSSQVEPILLKQGADAVFDGTKLTVVIAGTETFRYSGNFKWELEATIDSRKVTIGKGDFELIKTYMK